MARGCFANPSHESASEGGRRPNRDRFANEDVPKSPTTFDLIYSIRFQVSKVVNFFLMVVNLFETK